MLINRLTLLILDDQSGLEIPDPIELMFGKFELGLDQGNLIHERVKQAYVPGCTALQREPWKVVHHKKGELYG